MKSRPIVRLKMRVRLPNGSRPYLDPVFAANKKLNPGHARLKGRSTHFPDGVYHLRYLRGSRRVWEAVGSDPQLALTAKQRREREMEDRASGTYVPDANQPQIRTLTDLKEAVAEYLAEVESHKSKGTFNAYEIALRFFMESCSKRHLEAVDRKDILSFMSFLRAKGNAARTVANRVEHLQWFFCSLKVKWPLDRSDKPRFTEKAVSAYSKADIKALLAVAQGEEAEMLQFFLFTGARKQEVKFATWRDVDFEAKTFTVREKLDLGFTPKDREEGAIPIPDSLVELLRGRRTRNPLSRLIFTNGKGDPESHSLRILKRLGLRAGLNCGHCYSGKKKLCCSEHPVCTRFELHRLRKTFATMHHEAGIPVRTIQRWLRHSDLNTTLRYLAASDDLSERTREQVNNTFAFVADSA